MQRSVIVTVALGCLLIASCNSERKIMNFYSENKEQLGKVKQLSQELAGKYTFKYAAIRDHGPQIGIRLNVQDDDAYKGTGEYYDRKPCNRCLTLIVTQLYAIAARKKKE